MTPATDLDFQVTDAERARCETLEAAMTASTTETILFGDAKEQQAERLRELYRRKRATEDVVEKLESDLKVRLGPLEKRKDDLRTAIELLQALEGEADDAITAIEREMRPAIEAAEADAAAADDDHWKAYRDSRK